MTLVTKTISHYKIVSLLGEGVMGQLWKGQEI